MDDLRKLDRLAPTAREQLGLLTTRQLRRVGIDRFGQSRLAEEGHLHHTRRGVWATGLGEPSLDQLLRAALLATDDRAAVSHLSAANRHGLWQTDELHVSVRKPANPRLAGVRVHRCDDLHDSDITVLEGVRTTTIERTLCDIGLVLPPPMVHRVLDHAIATGVVCRRTVERLRDRIGKQGRTGAGIIRAGLADLPEAAGRADSGAEVTVLRRLTAAGLPPPVLQHTVEAGGRRYRLDLAYPTNRIAIEYDGEQWHSSTTQRRSDQRREGHLTAAGWTVIRFDKHDLNSTRATIVTRVRHALAAA